MQRELQERIIVNEAQKAKLTAKMSSKNESVPKAAWPPEGWPIGTKLQDPILVRLAAQAVVGWLPKGGPYEVTVTETEDGPGDFVVAIDLCAHGKMLLAYKMLPRELWRKIVISEAKRAPEVRL